MLFHVTNYNFTSKCFNIGQPLFPGNSETDQLHRIIEVVGMPNPATLEQATRSKLFFGK